MKGRIAVLLVFFVSFQGFSQQKQLTDSYPYSIHSSDSGFVLIGQLSIEGDNQGLVSKYQKDGELVWERLVGGISWEGFSDVDFINEQIILTGNTRSQIIGSSDFMLVEVNPENGDTISTRFYGTKHFDLHKSSVTTSTGFFMAGNMGAYGAGLDDVMLVKTGLNKKLKKAMLFGSVEADNVNRIKYLSNGKIAVCGSTSPGIMGMKDGFVMVMDTGNLAVTFLRYTGGADDDNLFDVVFHSGYYYALGSTNSVGFGSSDVFVVKLTESGSKLWSVVIGEWLYEKPHDLLVYNNEIYLSGYMQSISGSFDDFFVAKMNLDGDVVKAKQFPISSGQYSVGLEKNDTTLSMMVLSNNGAWSASVYESDTSFSYLCDSSIVALQYDFANVPVTAQVFSGMNITDSVYMKSGIEVYYSDSLFVPFEYCMYEIDTVNGTIDSRKLISEQVKVFPNPTSDMFSISAEAHVKSAQFFTYSGQLINKLDVNNAKNIDVSGLPSGFYLLKLEDDRNNTYFVKLIKSEKDVK